MSGVAALIFDVDGTLADTEELHRQAFNAAFASFGWDCRWSAELYRELLGVSGGKERIASYLQRLRLSQAEQERLHDLIPSLHACKNRIYGERLTAGAIWPRAGVRRLMLEGRRSGVRLAIASTTSLQNIEPLLHSAFGRGALSWFSAIATGDVVAAKKPAPDIYNLVLQSLELPPAAAVAFEDSTSGVRAAQAAGIFTVAVPNRWTQEHDFSSAELRLESLGEPDRPLDHADQARIGAPYLTMRRLQELHFASEVSRSVHAGCG